ncbi:MAG: alpha/beta fold hydrolase [Planctomycetaceae bacterium]|nr:alpha/beta fold hydrolase [Planctomycetaceae bacterium]
MSDFDGYQFSSHFFEVGGLRYHYIDERAGNGLSSGGGNDVSGDDDGGVLLMVHGNPTWSYMWRRLILAFRGKYRCVAVDHIGCGLSDKPVESVYEYTLSRRVDDLVRFIEDRDLRKITLVGHDWGGVIGMGAAVKLFDRFDRFVLMNTAAFRSIDCPLRIRFCRLPFLGRFLVQGLNIFSIATMWMAVSSRRHLPFDVRSAFLAPYNSWSNRVAIYKFVQDIPLSPHHCSYEILSEIEDFLPQFREKRMCFIWGMLDWCFSPEFLKRFLQYFPDANVYRLENAHHLLLEDAPDEVIAAMNDFFVKELGDKKGIGDIG